jgi:hypothetical protein
MVLITHKTEDEVGQEEGQQQETPYDASAGADRICPWDWKKREYVHCMNDLPARAELLFGRLNLRRR